jgi:hypothetical protein
MPKIVLWVVTLFVLSFAAPRFGNGPAATSPSDADPQKTASAVSSDCAPTVPMTGADIQKAVDAGGIVKIPAGVYVFSQTIVVRKSNTIIQGAGPGTVFIFQPSLPQVHCVNDRAFTTPCGVVDTTRRQITHSIAVGDYSFPADGDLSDLASGDWLIINERDRNAGTQVIVDWAQVASVSGNVVQLRTPFRTAFPNARDWDPVVSGLGFYRISHLVEGVQFRNFTVIVPDSGEAAPCISVFAAKGTLIDGVIAQDRNGQPLYSYLAKDLTICNSNGDGSQSLTSTSEFGSTVDLTVKNNTFSSDSAAVALDLGTAFFEVSRNYIPSSGSIGLYLLYGVHDGTVNDNFISFVRSSSGNAVGIAVRGSQRVTIARNYLAGGAGSSSIGITIGSTYNTEVPILSSQNQITPNFFGASWAVQYDPTNTP